MTEPMLTITQIAALCRVSPKTVRRWIRARRLRAVKIGRLVRVSPAALRAFLSRATVADNPNKSNG